ncbi:MAG: hypothetical protein IPP47_18815 [Bryobacterales bacterium]|nr:hypothetical protein [Bryobacterales bacterium]
MYRIGVLALLCAACLAQSAKELLQTASEMVSTASPGVQVPALLELALLYQDSDRKKTLELLDQAMAAAGTSTLQARVVRTAADVDVDKAIEMAPSVPVQQRTEALERIVTALVARKRLDRAIEVLEASAGQGGYPYRAADNLLSKLAEDDPRRASQFASATAALTPDSRTTDYARLLAHQWRRLPRPLVDGAVAKLVNLILDEKSDTTTISTLSSSLGSVSFSDDRDYQLFDIMHILQVADPKKAAELKEKRPALASALEKFPEGRLSMKASDSDNINTNRNTTEKNAPNDPQAAARMQMQALSQAKAQEALALARKDVQLGVSRAAEVPDPTLKADALTEIAQLAAGKDPATAKSVIGQAIAAMKEIKDPEATANLWAAVASAATEAKDDEMARDAIDKGLTACAALYKLDSNADDPNEAPREYWPSVQHYRNLLYKAAKVNGTETALLLVKINDPDLQLMGRIEVARSLMGKPRGDMNVWVRRGNRMLGTSLR